MDEPITETERLLLRAYGAEARTSLDEDALARALFDMTMAEPGLLSDVDMLNDPATGNTRPAAEAIAQYYRRAILDKAGRP